MMKKTPFKKVTNHIISESLIGETVMKMAKRMEWVYITGVLTYASKMNKRYWYKHTAENKNKVKSVLKEYKCEFTIDEKQVNISPFFEGDERGFESPAHSVYVIGNIKQNLFKIGYSNNVDKRIETLQSASPFDLSIVKIFKNKGYNFEKHLHNHLQKYHKRGEWFYIDFEELQDILSSQSLLNLEVV